MSGTTRVPSFALVFACALAFVLGVASASAESASRAAATRAVATSAPSSASPAVRGLAPRAGGAKPALSSRPPGALEDEDGPSRVIFPPERLTIRFNHRKHVKELGVACERCHERAKTSIRSSDSLAARPARCDACHGTDHTDLSSVQTSPDELIGQCGYCHVGYRAGRPVARMSVPKPNLRFSHAAHAARNIGCQQCHGAVQELELATRDSLPRMRGCFRCHQAPEPARGDAKGACATCHLTEKDGLLMTRFPSGALRPPSWLGGAGHGPDWLERHRTAAAADARLCASCHTAASCTECHDGRVRPREVHPNDWLAMHPIAAKQDSPRCTSCHRQQSFCLTCHQRAGVTMSGPTENLAGRGRFHPPPSVWTDAPRGPGHHAWEAQRNLNTCVSCHTERDCVLCHSNSGVGGRGAGTPTGAGWGSDPHPAGFSRRCRGALRKNARPCLVCHDPADPKLDACR
ncbi:MAG: cytochrome c family protein [Sorangiineae bacterium]|nr:cytochrome c family protein [Polyangiaceae bacterium]MEB2323583.1 cytochrome c family protein [Sorangiineae bacterium]